MPKLFDRVKVSIPTTGAGTVTFGAATSSAFLLPSEAGAIDGDTVRYILIDGTDMEEGVGTIMASSSQMARTTVTRSKIGGVLGATKLNLSGTAVLAFTVSSADILNPANNLSDLNNVSAARSNIGVPGIGAANTFTDATEATGDGTTAAAIISGGLEVLKKLFVTGLATFKGAVSITDATASTSATTGALKVGGGVGVGGAIHAGAAINSGGAVGGTGMAATGSAASAWHFDGSATAMSIANGASATLSAGSGMVLVRMGEGLVNGAVFLCSGGITVLLGQVGSMWEANTVSPAAGHASICYNGSNYAIYNNQGLTLNFHVSTWRCFVGN